MGIILDKSSKILKQEDTSKGYVIQLVQEKHPLKIKKVYHIYIKYQDEYYYKSACLDEKTANKQYKEIVTNYKRWC